MRSGVAGMSIWRMRNARPRASTIAFITPRHDPIPPASPAPLPPSGFVRARPVRGSDLKTRTPARGGRGPARSGRGRTGRECVEIGGEVARGPRDRRSSARDRARPTGAAAGRDAIGIALHDPYPLRRNVEMVGDELGIGGVMALPGRLRADQHFDAAVRPEPELGILRAVAAAPLHIRRKPASPQPAGFLPKR